MMAAPLVIAGVAGLAAVVMGSLLSDMLAGSWINLSGVGWLVATAGYGSFLAFYFWIDAAMVRARAGAPFATGGASFRTAALASAAALGAALVAVPTTLTILLRLGTSYVPGAGGICLATAALTFVAAVAGAIACFKARRKLAAAGAEPPVVAAVSATTPGWREAAFWFIALALLELSIAFAWARTLNLWSGRSLLSLVFGACFLVPVRKLRWPALALDTGFRIWVQASSFNGRWSLFGVVWLLVDLFGRPVAYYVLLRDAVPRASRMWARGVLALVAFMLAAMIAFRLARP
jgi:hypothetical protein